MTVSVDEAGSEYEAGPVDDPLARLGLEGTDREDTVTGDAHAPRARFGAGPVHQRGVDDERRP
jgi:hypothetical protein